MQKTNIIIVCLLLFALQASAQQLKLDPSSSATIKGTSTMHDWESEVEKINGDIEITTSSNSVIAINSLNLSFGVESIKSGKKKMDKLTYEAFDAEKNPRISFKMTEVKRLEGDQATVLGELTMAGNTQQVEITGVCKMENGAVNIIASQQINMEQFGMERPTAMLGAIKVGAEVVVEFSLNFK